LAAGGREDFFYVRATAVFATDTVNSGGNEYQAFKCLVTVITLEFVDRHFGSLGDFFNNIIKAEDD